MKKLFIPLAALMLVPVSLAERIPDRTWENEIEEVRQKLQFQTTVGDWIILENSPEEGFAAATSDGRDKLLMVLCIPETSYGAAIVFNGEDTLGTDYDDLGDQPVTLNWKNPDRTQKQQWSHLSLGDSDTVTAIDILKPELTDAFLDQLTQHQRLNSVVTVSKSGRTKQATFSLAGAPSAETVKACGQEQTSAGTTLYFPDFVDGGGWSVQLVLSNTAATSNGAAVTVRVYDSEGDAIRRFFDSDSTLEIPALGSRVLSSAGSGSIRRGWIEVEADSTAVSGLLTYRNVQSGVEVGVNPVELGNQFALFVEESSGISTGLAIFKPESEPAIELRIRDEDGRDPLDGVFVPRGDFQQLARTMSEWFAVEGVDTEFLRDFRGLLFLRSEDGSLFAPLGLRFGKQTSSLSAVPVIRGGNVSGGMPPE